MYQLLIFDLDGTLTESKPGIVNSVRYALRRFGLEEPDERRIESFIGPPLAESFSRNYGFSAEQAREAIEVYREYFAERGLFENSLYPGIAELLAALRQRDVRLAVGTAKPQIYAEQILDHFGVLGHFDIVVGSRFDGSHSDKAELVAAVLRGLSTGGDRRVAMIGDRYYDVEGARACGVDSIAVGYGYGPIEELEASHPTHRVDSVAALSSLLLDGRG